LQNNKYIKQKYEQLFREYFTSLTYFSQKYVGDLDTAKEIVHNVFIKVWEKRECFDFDKSSKSYLFTSVYNRSLNYLRDQKKFASEEEALHSDEGINNDHLEAAELESKIWKVINSLPEKCKEIFIANRFEEKKYAEIAEEKGISVKTVETQMSKALKVLREHLKDYIHILVLFLLKSGF